MMLGRLTVWDMKFQIKYGFYLLYSVLTVIYLIILQCPNLGVQPRRQF